MATESSQVTVYYCIIPIKRKGFGELSLLAGQWSCVLKEITTFEALAPSNEYVLSTNMKLVTISTAIYMMTIVTQTDLLKQTTVNITTTGG